MLLCGLASAQEGEILYFDLVPDSTRTFHNWVQVAPPIPLDVDRDGICEWSLESRDGGHQSIGLHLKPNVHPFVDTLELYTRLRLNFAQIGDTLANTDFIMNEYIWGNLGEYPNLMVGLRYLVDEGYCYGWFSVSVKLYEPAPIYGASTIDVAVHEMAYCTIPNYPLCAGQTDFTWDMSENISHPFATLHPNPTTGLVTLTGKGLKTAEVLNTLGQQVATAQGQGESMQVDIANLPAGVYFVRITDEEGHKCVRKVVKE